MENFHITLDSFDGKYTISFHVNLPIYLQIELGFFHLIKISK